MPFLAHLPFGARNGQICFEFLLLCCRPRKSRFSMKTGCFWFVVLLAPEMFKFATNFCYCAVDPEKAVFPGKRAVSPEMIKSAPNFCYFAVDQEKAVFEWKRAISGPSCPLGARNGQICTEFLLLCCRPRKGRFSMETGRFWAICPSGRPKWSNLLRISAIVL